MLTIGREKSKLKKGESIMNKLSDKRLAKLDEAISIYDCMRKIEDAVVIKMSKDLFAELIAVNHPFFLLCGQNVIYSTDGLYSNRYKGHILGFVSNENYVAVAYFNTMTGKLHNIREIKED